MDRAAWRTTVPGVTESDMTERSRTHTHTHTRARAHTHTDIDLTFIISACHLRVREMVRTEAPHVRTLMMKYVMLCFEWWNTGGSLNIVNGKLLCRYY